MTIKVQQIPVYRYKSVCCQISQFHNRVQPLIYIEKHGKLRSESYYITIIELTQQEQLNIKLHSSYGTMSKVNKFHIAMLDQFLIHVAMFSQFQTAHTYNISTF